MLQEKQLIAWFHKIKMGTHGCAIAFFLHNLLLQQMHKSAGVADDTMCGEKTMLYGSLTSLYDTNTLLQHSHRHN